MADTAKKILVIRHGPLKFFVQSIPALAAIREKHKDDKIVLLTEEGLKEFAENLGYFNKVWVDEMPEWFMFKKWKHFLKNLRGSGFSRVYDLQNSKRTEWYFRLAGFRKPEWNCSIVPWCSHYYQIPKNEIMHFQEVLHNQLRVAGIVKAPDVDLSFLAGEPIIQLPEKYCLICPGGNKDNVANKYNPENYVEIIKYLHSEYQIVSLIIGKTRSDFNIANFLIQEVGQEAAINLVGKTRINDVITLAKGAVFTLGNETAPTHIAAYSGGCKTIMLCSRFSPPQFIAPRVRNVAVIEEPFLENLYAKRITDAIYEFALKKEETVYKQM